MASRSSSSSNTASACSGVQSPGTTNGRPPRRPEGNSGARVMMFPPPSPRACGFCAVGRAPSWAGTARHRPRSTIDTAQPAFGKALVSDPDIRRPVLCLDRQNACPPEDVGRAPGYADFLKAIADPTYEEHDRFFEWCGGRFDPVFFKRRGVRWIVLVSSRFVEGAFPRLPPKLGRSTRTALPTMIWRPIESMGIDT